MTLREISADVLAVLQSECDLLGLSSDLIMYGKFGQMPSECPCIWLYAAPISQTVDEDGSISRAKASLSLWCIVGSDDGGAFGALEMAERALNVVCASCPNVFAAENPIQFDADYGDYSVVSVDLTCNYTPVTHGND